MSIDFGAIEEGSGESFRSALKGIPKLLTKGTVRQFYDAALNVLENDDVKLDNKSRILIALCQTISEDDYLKEFVAGEYLQGLPYNDEALQVQLFDVLYIIASSSPVSLTEEVAQKLDIILPSSPRRSLGVLSVYAKNFDAVKRYNWQPVLDLLTRPGTSDIFKTRLYVKDYVSLLCFLCEKQQYRKEKYIDVWNAICSCLTVNRDESICLCYYGLVRLCDKGYVKQDQCQFPSSAVACNLRRQHCQKAALSLLMRWQPKGEDNGISDVVSSLVWAAHTELNANLLLVQLAKNEAIAQALVRDASWMVQELPTKVDTMRLFAVVLSHDSLMDEISKKNEAIAFLRNALELDTPGVLSAITTFTRRFRVDKDFAKFCSDYGFLSTYFQYALGRKDKTSVNATLLFIHTFASAAYSHDLLQTCDYVSDLVRDSKGTTSLHAARVACDLAQYPKCAARFQSLELDDYFIENQNDPNVKKAGVHFLRALQKAYNDEKRNANRPKEAAPKFVTSRTYRTDPSEENPRNPVQNSRQLTRRSQPASYEERRSAGSRSSQRQDQEDKRSVGSRNSQYQDQEDKRSVGSRNSQNREQEDRRSTGSRNSYQDQEQEDKRSVNSQNSQADDQHEQWTINDDNSQPEELLDEDSENHQPSWVVNQDSQGSEANNPAILEEEEDENSAESSTQLIIPQSSNLHSDDFEYNEEEDSSPFMKLSNPVPKPPSPRRNRE